MKNKLVYVPSNGFDKELFVQSIYTHESIDFIGTAESEYILKRFIKLYSPDTIIFFSTKESLSDHLKWCTEISLTNRRFNIAFILDNGVLKYSPLCLRAGSNIIFSTDYTLDYMLKVLESCVRGERLPLQHIKRVVDTNKLKRGYHIPKEIFRKIMDFYLKNGENYEKSGIFTRKMLKSIKKRLKFESNGDVLYYLKNEGFLPKNGPK